LVRAVLRTQEEHPEYTHDELPEVESDEDPQDRISDSDLIAQGARREIAQSISDEGEREYAPSSGAQRPEFGPFTAKGASKSRSGF
jgi:hypothetical protein